MTSNDRLSKKPLVSVVIPTLNRREEAVACSRSLTESEYQNIEIIVVDNGSVDDTVSCVSELNDPRIKLIRSKVNLGAGGGRNRGAKAATGKYLLFVDSDNVVDSKMISQLVDFLERNSDCGMVGPLMLIKSHPDRVWTYFADIDMYSSRAFYKGYGEKNSKQYADKILTGHIPNCFMVKKTDFETIGGFDEKYLIMYEEADLAEKIKKCLKKRIYIFTKAVTYHNVEFTKTNDYVSFRSAERAFLTARNRVYFMKRNATFLQFIIFFLIFNPLIFFYYEYHLLKKGEFTKARSYAIGLYKGFFL